MKVAVLSGKGGSGKTFVAVNLAATAGEATYIDCDVEEPNGHLFFKPEIQIIQPVDVKIPEVDHGRCDSCRKCVEFCKFNALAFIGEKVMLFQEVCHACGGCALVCPRDAITETSRNIGQIQDGISGDVRVLTGMLNPGEAAGVPVIRKLLKLKDQSHYTFIDCPPGSACSVMESIQDADYCLLVAEPTIFGLHNVKMVHQLVKLFGKPHGMILNKCLEGENPSEIYAVKEKIPILGKIPFDTHIGDMNARGMIAVNEDDEMKHLFTRMLNRVREVASDETALNPQR